MCRGNARRITSRRWYRFRRTVEDRPTVITVISEEACTRSCAALTLELKGVAGWSRASEPAGQSNVLPMRKPIPVNQPLVTHGSLLHLNSIQVNRQRPISPWVDENQFRAYA